jgi:hypothetical protein
MFSRIARKLRWPLAGAGAAALIGVSVAGATDNAPLVVGQTTSATKQTALQGSMASPVLLINPGSTATGAYGLSVNGNSSNAPAIGGGNSGSGIGFRGLSVSGIGAQGLHTGTSASGAGGVEGQSSASAGTGVKGIAANGGQAKGVYGVSNSGYGGYFSATAGGWGVYAEGTYYGVNATAGSDSGIGVLGTQPSMMGSGPGVEGVSQGTIDSGGVGVKGITDVATGVEGDSTEGLGVYGNGGSIGVEGQSPSYAVVAQSTDGVGVQAYSGSGDAIQGLTSTGRAGYFQGNVIITGALTVNGGCTGCAGAALKIDHPRDPAHKYLQHSFVESPDMLDVYNGNVVTNGKGFATVRLPAYFEALNRSFRYQLTIVGTRGWNARVVKEIAHNRFTVQTDQPNVKVSWQVTGIRHDPYANAHRIKVVVPKTGSEQGKYLHPELYGQPKSKGIGAEATRPHRGRVLPARKTH